MASQLQKLTDITLSGETYHLAANGQASLVSPQGKDAYGNDFAVKVDLVEFLTENLREFSENAKRFPAHILFGKPPPPSKNVP